jgi:hypothetical protein
VTRHGHRGRTIGILAVSVFALVTATSGLVATTGRSAALDTSQRITRTFPGGPYFNVVCGFSHRNNDDPIVFPGAPGRSHNHTYIGNRTVDASSTPESLKGGSSTCEELDSSTYWVPTLYEGVDAVTPLAAVLYYTRHTSGPIVAPPAGLKMVAGNAKARRAQSTSVVSFSCGGAGSKRFSTIPQCSENTALVFNVRFPNCWTGNGTDSVDHKRHMAYSLTEACPKSHPVRLPTIDLALIYPPTSRHARPSSGKFAAHADFMNGWDLQLLERLISGLNY